MKSKAFCGVAFRQLREIRAFFDDVFVLQQGEGRHVVAVGEPEVLVEALPRGQEDSGVAQVPLANRRRRVADRLEHVGDGHLPGIEPDGTARLEDVRHADPYRVTAGHQRGPGRRTDGRADVEVGELDAFGGEAVEVGRGEPLRAEHADVGVALVVGEHDDDVGAVGQGLPPAVSRRALFG